MPIQPQIHTTPTDTRPRPKSTRPLSPFLWSTPQHHVAKFEHNLPGNGATRWRDGGAEACKGERGKRPAATAAKSFYGSSPGRGPLKVLCVGSTFRCPRLSITITPTRLSSRTRPISHKELCPLANHLVTDHCFQPKETGIIYNTRGICIWLVVDKNNYAPLEQLPMRGRENSYDRHASTIILCVSIDPWLVLALSSLMTVVVLEGEFGWHVDAEAYSPTLTLNRLSW